MRGTGNGGKKIKKKTYILIAVTLGVQAVLIAACDGAEPPHGTEYQVKAAFLYNFVKFTEWPAAKLADGNEIILGLVGSHPFGNAFEPVKDKLIKGRPLIIRELGDFGELRKRSDQDKTGQRLEELKKCHLLFICDSQKNYFKEIIETVKDCNVLTVGETGNFLEFGGIITFVMKAEKLTFEVNLIAAKREGLQISSQVLRLAERVITEDEPAGNRQE